jgi:chorismate mutase
MVSRPADADRHLARAAVCALRGATTVARDEAPLVRDATAELLTELLARNGLTPDDLVSAIFTVTPDLASEFPARAARALGWHDVPLLCAQEIAVPHALPRCIRVLLHAVSHRPRRSVQHVYLRRAAELRPDLATVVDGGGIEPRAAAGGDAAAASSRRRARAGVRELRA